MGGLTLPAGAARRAACPPRRMREDIARALHGRPRRSAAWTSGKGAVVCEGLVLAGGGPGGHRRHAAPGAGLPAAIRGAPGAAAACWPRRPSRSRSSASTCRPSACGTIEGAARGRAWPAIVGEAGGCWSLDRDGGHRRRRPAGPVRGAAWAPGPVTPALCVMLVAAEASATSLGARPGAGARKRRLGGGVRFVGVGGAQMAAEGVHSPFDISEPRRSWACSKGCQAYRAVRAPGAPSRRPWPSANGPTWPC